MGTSARGGGPSEDPFSQGLWTSECITRTVLTGGALFRDPFLPSEDPAAVLRPAVQVPPVVVQRPHKPALGEQGRVSPIALPKQTGSMRPHVPFPKAVEALVLKGLEPHPHPVGLTGGPCAFRERKDQSRDLECHSGQRLHPPWLMLTSRARTLAWSVGTVISSRMTPPSTSVVASVKTAVWSSGCSTSFTFASGPGQPQCVFRLASHRGAYPSCVKPIDDSAGAPGVACSDGGKRRTAQAADRPLRDRRHTTLTNLRISCPSRPPQPKCRTRASPCSGRQRDPHPLRDGIQLSDENRTVVTRRTSGLALSGQAPHQGRGHLLAALRLHQGSQSTQQLVGESETHRASEDVLRRGTPSSRISRRQGKGVTRSATRSPNEMSLSSAVARTYRRRKPLID
jgi:hypothetical protein